MGNYLDQTWLAYALHDQGEPERADRGLERVQSHYQRLHTETLRRDACGDSAMGMALWQRPNKHLRWPLWERTEYGYVASTSPLTGWRGVVGDADPGAVPGLLG